MAGRGGARSLTTHTKQDGRVTAVGGAAEGVMATNTTLPSARRTPQPDGAAVVVVAAFRGSDIRPDTGTVCVFGYEAVEGDGKWKGRNSVYRRMEIGVGEGVKEEEQDRNRIMEGKRKHEQYTGDGKRKWEEYGNGMEMG